MTALQICLSKFKSETRIVDAAAESARKTSSLPRISTARRTIGTLVDAFILA